MKKLFALFILLVASPAPAQVPARSHPAILYRADGSSGYSIAAHDSAAAAIDPMLFGCYASAAAPSDVSADNDAVRMWCLRSGALAIQPTFGGVLWSTGNGIAGTGTPRVTIASDNTAFSVNAIQSGTWSVRAQDGSGNALASSTTTPAGTEQALIVRNIPSGTQTISGTVTANAGTGTFTVSGTTFDGVLKDGVGDTTEANVTSGRLHVDGSGVTQPVSGTVTANAGTGTFFDGIIRDGTGDTTQANVTSGRLNVDGSGVTQPVSGTVTANAGTGNFGVNQVQIGGVSISTGNGTAGTGVQRVAIVSDNSAISGMGVGATGAAPPANAGFVGGLGSGATGGFLRGVAVCDSFVNVNVNTATTTLLVTGVSGRHVRICSLSLVTAAANNVALISGTGATCGTGTTGMNGGTSAASGWNFGANGGLSQGSGIGQINQTNATGDSVCIVTSAAVQLSGRVSYTIY